MGGSSNLPSDKTFSTNDSRVAQWKRAGPITQRSVDRNYVLLMPNFLFLVPRTVFHLGSFARFAKTRIPSHRHVPLAQRIARWTSNPKVLGSIPRWDEKVFTFGGKPVNSNKANCSTSSQDGRVV